MAKSTRVALVVGASRGIGRQIAIDLAREGYQVIVSAKSTSDAYQTIPFPPDPNSQHSTISTVVREIQEAGGQATAVSVDTRDPDSIQRMLDETIRVYSKLDVLVYNSGAIWWASVQDTPLKRFQLMQRVNVEGLYSTVQAALPCFQENNWTGRIIVVSPPIYSRFFRGKTAYAMGKVAMSVLTKGLAMDWLRQGHDRMAITSIWPAAAIQSAATADLDIQHELRKPTVFSEAILAIINSPVSQVNGALLLDEDFLRSTGQTDFEQYALLPGSRPRRIMPVELPNLSVAEQDDQGRRVDSAKRASKL